MTARRNTCESTRERLLPYLAETLRDAEAQEIAAHLEACPACRDAYETLHAEYEALGLLPDTPPPPGLAARTVSEVMSAAEERKHPERPFRLLPWLAMAAVVMIVAAILLPALTRPREAVHRASTQNNMKQIGLAFKMYANEDKGERFPPLTPVEGAWVPDLRVLYPEYLMDPTVLLSITTVRYADDARTLQALLDSIPPDWEGAHRIVARHFIYTGYTLQSPEDFRRFTVAQSNRPERVLDQDLSDEGGAIYRLRDGIERFLITNINDPAQSTEARSQIPILIENIFSGDVERVPRGANVLYLDGRVEFIRADAEPEFFAALQDLVQSESP